MTLFGVVTDDVFSFIECSVALMPVSSTSSLSEIVSADMMGGALDQIVALLPIAIVAVVCYIGLRKGISWFQDVLRGA